MAVAVPFQGKFEREVKKMTIDEIAAKYGHEMQNDAADVLAEFKKSLPALYKKAADLYKREGLKSQKYIAAFDKFGREMQRLRQIGMDQKNLYSEYLRKMDSTFPSM